MSTSVHNQKKRARSAKRGQSSRPSKATAGAPANFSDDFWHGQPQWVAGTTISYYDARFLFGEALAHAESPLVELGTASGFSTAMLCHAMRFRAEAGRIDPEFDVLTYDIDRDYYADKSRRSGDAARELLPAALLQRVIFRVPAVAYDAARDCGPRGIGFLFIDANHMHPWPTLDFLAVLDSLADGATVVMHDINLPVIHPEFPDWGAKFLFDGLDLPKRVSDDPETPNIGSVTIPKSRRKLREQLLEILFQHEWKMDVAPAYLKAIGVEPGKRRATP